MERTIGILHHEVMAVRSKRYQLRAFRKRDASALVIFYVPNSRSSARIGRSNETVIRAPETESQRRAIAWHKLQLLVGFQIANDNVAGSVVGGITAHLRIKIPRIPGRRFGPLAKEAQVRKSQRRNRFIAKIKTVGLRGAFADQVQRIKTLAGETCHVTGARLVELRFPQRAFSPKPMAL